MAWHAMKLHESIKVCSDTCSYDSISLLEHFRVRVAICYGAAAEV